MALGKLTFLCLNAICIGMVALLVLGALMRLYGEQSPHVRSGRGSGRTAGGYSPRDVQSQTASESYDVRGEARQGSADRRRSERDDERQTLYEYDY